MRFTIAILLLLSLLCGITIAQDRKHNFQIGIANDNDVYLLKRSDRYYTNGIDLDFLMNLGTGDSSSQVVGLNLKHRLYNGVGVIEEDNLYWDRPFTAIFSLEGRWSKIITKNRVFHLNFILEQYGPRAKGEEIQGFIHHMFNMYEVDGWNTQLPNSFGVDFGARLEEDLFKGFNNSLGISSAISTIVGMNNIYFQAELPLRIGKFKAFNRSVFTNANLTSNELNNELFFFYRPMLKYQLKNASIDIVDNSQVLVPNNEMRHFVFTHEVGATLAKGKSLLTLSLFRYNTELSKMKYNHHQYGRIQFSRRF